MMDVKILNRGVAALAAAAVAATGGLLTAVAQVTTNVPDPVPGARPAIVERIKIHGQVLEGNLEGDAVDRDAIVFLPPSYNQNRTRRHPVVYALHGYSIGAEQWTQEIHVPQTIEGAFAKGAHEMIVVLPDSKTVHNGSMYSSSVMTGDFENYVARDVVSYVDMHYRTIATRESRGLVGHSMGGYVQRQIVHNADRRKLFERLARRIGRFPQLAHPGSRVKGVFNRGIWTSVASAWRHSRRTKETAPLSPRWQSKQPNATTSPDTAFELSRRRQIPPFAAVYTREPSGVRQRSVGGDPLRKKCSDRVRR
jgi:hypothetical protein